MKRMNRNPNARPQHNTLQLQQAATEGAKYEMQFMFTRDDDLVPRLGAFHHVVAADDVYAARHGARGNLVRVLLHAQALPVHEDALLHEDLEVSGGLALRVLADLRLSVLELLLHRGVRGAALLTWRNSKYVRKYSAIHNRLEISVLASRIRHRQCKGWVNSRCTASTPRF